MVAVRRLNDQGIHEFREWLEGGAWGSAPHELLTSPLKSEPLSAAIDVEQRSFSSRFDLGQYLNEKLQLLPFTNMAFDTGLWDWLTLFWFDQIAAPSATGKRNLREIARYSQDAGGRRWSRHVVRMSWLSVHNHGDNARYFLSTGLDRHTDVLEQIAGQQEIFGSRAAVALGAHLYWDKTANVLKRGAGGKSAGSPRRLSRFMKQIRMTYDPEAMQPEQLVELLPREFSRWREKQEPQTSAAPAAKGLLARLMKRNGTSASASSNQ
jgi:hypothetical protein